MPYIILVKYFDFWFSFFQKYCIMFFGYAKVEVNTITLLPKGKRRNSKNGTGNHE